jgi:hypothetical protein
MSYEITTINVRHHRFFKPQIKVQIMKYNRNAKNAESILLLEEKRLMKVDDKGSLSTEMKTLYASV